MAQGSGYRERNSTADRALTLLQMFTAECPELSAAEIAENLGVARSTAYRYLQTLVQSQFLTEDGRGAYRLGLKILELARIARRGYGLAEVCVPVMRALADEFHQTVLLTRQMGTAVICLEREESRDQYVRLSYERGTVLSLNAGASALALLAWMPEDQVRALLEPVPMKKLTQATVADLDELILRLEHIKKLGYAISHGEVDATAMGIAAPIFRPNGEVVAAISIVMLQSRVSPDEVDQMVAGVVSAGADLSEKIALLEE